MQAAHLHPAAGHGPGRPGVDPAGPRGPRWCAGGDGRGRAGGAGPCCGRPFSTPSRRSGRGCCWPRTKLPRPPAGWKSAASALTMTRATRGSRSIWCWRGSCLPRTAPPRQFALLGRLHAAADAQGRTGSVIEIAALQALALAATGEENAAVDTLAQALMLACPQSYVRVFADEGPPMSALLARLIAAQQADQAAARGVPLGCLAQVLRAFDGKDACPRRPARGRGGCAGPGRAADCPGVGNPGAAGHGHAEPAHRRGTGDHPWIRSKSTLATCWPSWGRPTAPRPSPGPASWA